MSENDKLARFMLWLRSLRMDKDSRAQVSGMSGVIIELVVTVVIAAVLYACILVTYLTDLQDNTSSMYAGDTAAPIVGIITVFYWLGVALLSVGMVRYSHG